MPTYDEEDEIEDDPDYDDEDDDDGHTHCHCYSSGGSCCDCGEPSETDNPGDDDESSIFIVPTVIECSDDGSDELKD